MPATQAMRKRRALKNNICISCGKWIWHTSERCRDCYNRDRPPWKEWPDPEELILMIETHGYKETQEILGVSYNGIRKRLERLGLPRPRSRMASGLSAKELFAGSNPA